MMVRLPRRPHVPDRPSAVDLGVVHRRGPVSQRASRPRRRLADVLLLPGCWVLLLVDWLWLRLVMAGAKPIESLDGVTPAKAAPFTSSYQPTVRIERPDACGDGSWAVLLDGEGEPL